MPETGLETFTTDELIAEIESRCDACVWTMIVSGEQRVERSEIARMRYVGGLFEAIGLVEKCRIDLLNQLRIEKE